MASEIKDINLAPSGERKIEWVRRNCDLLRTLEKEFAETRPFEGKRIALSVHLEAKTAYLCKVLATGGAQMFVTGSNPLSTQDDVAAALVKAGLEVHALASVLSFFGFLPFGELEMPLMTTSLPSLCAHLFLAGILCGISGRNDSDLAEDAHLAMLAK